MLDTMISPFLDQPDGNEFWLTCETGSPVAVAYCKAEAMTEGTWNLLLIAVDIEHQGMGIGRKMMDFIERKLCQETARILLVETSGLPEFERTREFYLQCEYLQVATVPEYYAAGDDKVIFWKKLNKL